MSGSSLDGLDLAMVEFKTDEDDVIEWKLLSGREEQFSVSCSGQGVDLYGPRYSFEGDLVDDGARDFCGGFDHGAFANKDSSCVGLVCETGGQVHFVSEDGVVGSSRRADVADSDPSRCNPDTDPE